MNSGFSIFQNCEDYSEDSHQIKNKQQQQQKNFYNTHKKIFFSSFIFSWEKKCWPVGNKYLKNLKVGVYHTEKDCEFLSKMPPLNYFRKNTQVSSHKYWVSTEYSILSEYWVLSTE